MGEIVPHEVIENKILMIRGHAVTRNIDRLPDDFMFPITRQEATNLKFHFGTSSWGGRRKLPRVFTEQGVSISLRDGSRSHPRAVPFPIP